MVIAGLADLARPVEQLSSRQSASLGVTGCIWARYSLVIVPINYNLFTVNSLLGMTGFWQLSRVLIYEYGLRKQAAEEARIASSVEDVD